MHLRASLATLLAGSGFAALLCASIPVHAANSSPAPAAPVAAAPEADAEEPLEPDSGTKRAAAPDQRTGHLYLDGAVSVSGLAGSVDSGVPSRTLAGTGISFGGTLGVGVSRYVVLQAFGEGSKFDSPSSCSAGCSGSSYAFGLGVRYHLAQGLAFDPWGSFGVGYRFASFRAQAPDPSASNPFKTQVYQGLDVARIAFGGNFYPTPFFGFGPFLEADFGTFLRRAIPVVAPADATAKGPTTYALFQLGIRVAFDPFRSGTKAKPSSTARVGWQSTTVSDGAR